MAGHRPFRELTRTLSPARKARAVSQQTLAGKLDVGQPAVAKIERRADTYVSNLRRYVEALGGELEITARLPEGSVTLDLEEAEEDARTKR